MTFGRRRGLALALTPAGSGERSRFSGGRGELVARGALPGLFASVGSRATQREPRHPWRPPWASCGLSAGLPVVQVWAPRLTTQPEFWSHETRVPVRAGRRAEADPWDRLFRPSTAARAGGCRPLSVTHGRVPARPPGLCVTPRPAPAPPTAQRGFLNRPCGAAPFATPCESHVPPLPSPAVTPWKPRAPADGFFLTVW